MENASLRGTRATYQPTLRAAHVPPFPQSERAHGLASALRQTTPCPLTVWPRATHSGESGASTLARVRTWMAYQGTPTLRAGESHGTCTPRRSDSSSVSSSASSHWLYRSGSRRMSQWNSDSELARRLQTLKADAALRPAPSAPALDLMDEQWVDLAHDQEQGILGTHAYLSALLPTGPYPDTVRGCWILAQRPPYADAPLHWFGPRDSLTRPYINALGFVERRDCAELFHVAPPGHVLEAGFDSRMVLGAGGLLAMRGYLHCFDSLQAALEHGRRTYGAQAQVYALATHGRPAISTRDHARACELVGDAAAVVSPSCARGDVFVNVHGLECSAIWRVSEAQIAALEAPAVAPASDETATSCWKGACVIS